MKYGTYCNCGFVQCNYDDYIPQLSLKMPTCILRKHCLMQNYIAQLQS